MIILDTNVVSELMRAPPDAQVHEWFEQQGRLALFTTSISKAEVLYGIALMPVGRRKAALTTAAGQMFSRAFAERVLPFDAAAASHYADVLATRRRTGNPIQTLDAQIAAIALVHGAVVATRDLTGFEGCGIDVINPWNAG